MNGVTNNNTNPFLPVPPLSSSERVDDEEQRTEIQLKEFVQESDSKKNPFMFRNFADVDQTHFQIATSATEDNGDEQDSLSSSSDCVHYTNSNVSDLPFRSDNETGYHHPTLPELPPLSGLTVSRLDVLFNALTCFFSALGFILEATLIFLHYGTGYQWASALTALWLAVGGILILKCFWTLSQDKLERMYGEQNKCVRLSGNSVPWLITVITSFLSTWKCWKSIENPMQIHHYVQLQDWNRILLRIQSFGEAAPQAVLQVVVLLELEWEISEHLEVRRGVGIHSWKVTIMLLSIVTCMTNMMIANLPLKSDVVLKDDGRDVPPQPSNRALYSPWSRVQIGLRMVSSFASRTMSLALFLASFRCTAVVSKLGAEQHLTPVLSHLIPLSIIIFPRIFLALGEYFNQKCSSNNPETSNGLASILVTYTASVFVPFSEPRWIFWYVTLESLLFVGIGTGLMFWDGGGGCLGLWAGIGYLLGFLVLFVIVPVLGPWATVKLRSRRTAGRQL